jgi:Endonuclease/Exonuclease/phosphatase family
MLSVVSVYLFLAGLLVAPFAVLSAAPAYADTPANTPFITWNMQGVNTGGQNVWTTYLPQLLANNSPDVIMLQEAGANPPATAAVQPNPTGDGRVEYYL